MKNKNKDIVIKDVLLIDTSLIKNEYDSEILKWLFKILKDGQFILSTVRDEETGKTYCGKTFDAEKIINEIGMPPLENVKMSLCETLFWRMSGIFHSFGLSFDFGRQQGFASYSIFDSFNYNKKTCEITITAQETSILAVYCLLKDFDTNTFVNELEKVIS